MNRVVRIRRMIQENKDDPDLLVPDFLDNAPWNVAVLRRRESAEATFDAGRVTRPVAKR
jgi:hypothetical protein